MAEYSRIAKGHYTATSGSAQVINLPFIPDAIELFNFTAATTPAQNGIPYAYWDAQMGQGYAMYDVFNATPVLTTASTTSAGFSTFSAGYPQYGSAVAISGITKANPAVVTCTGNHGYSTGDTVVFQGLIQSSTTGMQQICGIPLVITVTGATTFTVPWNTNQTNYTAISGSPSGANVRKVLYAPLYFPGSVVISAISGSASALTVSTASNHNLVVGSEVAFRIPSAWGSVELNTPQTNPNIGLPVYGFVTSVSSATQVVIALINSSITFTAFNSNPTVAQAQAGLSFPQMVTVGDNNTGALTSAYTPTTINPIAIGGAFQNNTRQGFIIGAAGSGASLSGTTSDVVYWRAYLSDLGA